MKKINFETKIIIFLVILLVLFPFINLHNMEFLMYYFGLLFFLVGFFIGALVEKYGIIFLISHGVSGLVMVLASLLGFSDINNNFFNNPVLSDGYTKILIIYFLIVFILIALALVSLIISNLKGHIYSYKNSKVDINSKPIILSLGLFTMAIFLVAILPKIYIYLGIIG